MNDFDYDDIDLDRRMNNKQLSKRFFCVLAISHIEGMTLNMKDIDYMKRDYEHAAITFIKWQIQQSNQILQQLILMI